MTSPTADEILEIFEDLNYPSATKLRAALIKKGYKARQKDVDEFVKSQTPTQLFAKAPTYRGKSLQVAPIADGLWTSSMLTPSHLENTSTSC